MKHYAKENDIGGWKAACGGDCWIPDDLTDRKPSVRCRRCKKTKIFKAVK